jgi:broad specificity phosphatase PhoE
MLAGVEPRWAKPGNFALEVFVSQYSRAQQTARVVLDQMSLLSIQPRVRPLLNEREYGVTYDPRMDTDPNFDGSGSESAAEARNRVTGLMEEFESLLGRADVLAFSHYGTIRALIANLTDLDDEAMMQIDVPNGGAFLFLRTFDEDGQSVFTAQPLPDHVLEKTASLISQPPAAPPPTAV